MDRRSWLWRRKSSEKSPGETESSLSGSISSPSDRFSDEQQVYSNQTTQSPEVTSKAEPPDEDVNNTVKILTEKLSAALASISAKEESVQQHAKVAEEAVTGWEKAEKEVITLKQQLDAATKKNSSLEDRVHHLDGALKECLRQLRQVREEQDQKIQEAISNISRELEEAQLVDLRSQLETAKAKAEAAASLEADLRLRLASAEKENESLRLELQSRLQELEVRTLERDLSTKTAETASKQNLESTKRVAKLEAECRRLKPMARKASNPSPSIMELDHFKVKKAPSKNTTASSPEINLMDDFLEMERLAAIPERESRSCSLGSVTSTDKHGADSENLLKAEVEAMINRTSELEEKIEMLEAEKSELGMALTQCQNSLAQLKAQFNACQNQLKISQGQLRDSNRKMDELKAELGLANELRQAIELELEDGNVRREEAESHVKAIEDESKILLSRVGFLEGEAVKERALYMEVSSKCRALEDELSGMKCEVDTWQSQLASMKNSKEEVKRELQSIKVEKEEAESQLRTIQAEAAKCKKLEEELSRTKCETDTWRSRVASANDSKEAVEQQLQTINARKVEVESQLRAVQAKAKSLLAKVGTLEAEAEKERASSAEFAAKCRKLEDELSKMKCEADLRFGPLSKEELNIQQEKELTAIAASKLAECQKTIASLGKQLKSLATLEDLFIDSDKLLEASEKESQLLQNGLKHENFHLSAEFDSFASETVRDSLRVSREDDRGFGKNKEEGMSMSSLSEDKSQKNGFGRFFSGSKSAMRS